MVTSADAREGCAAVEVRDVTFAYPGSALPAVAGVSCRFDAGTLTAILGTNGSGKSTLLKVMAGAVRPHTGTVHVHGDDVRGMSDRRRARSLAIMHQHLPPVSGLTVAQFLAQADYGRKGLWGMLPGGVSASARLALEDVGMSGAEDTYLDQLSGGQRQRVRFAACLAQGAPVVAFDEPTAHLDVEHQVALLQHIRLLAAERGKTVIVVVHDLAHAALVADRVLVLRAGQLVVDGTPREVLTARNIEDLFSVRSDIDWPDPSTVRQTFALTSKNSS